MESLLWACNLIGVAYLCFWALREDGALPSRNKKAKKPDA